MTDKVVPNPGSEEAKKQGCLCPRMDNNYGKGCGYGDGLFWISDDCPLHGKEQSDSEDELAAQAQELDMGY